MFGSSFGTEVSWLLPTALILLVAGLWFTRRAARTSSTRAALIMWGGWLGVTAGIFSFMSGIIHPYYAVALAPAIAALVGIGGVELWRGRGFFPARIVLAVAVLVTDVWSAVLLSQDVAWLPWLKILIVILGALTATGLLFGLDRFRRGAAALVITSLLAGGLGTAAWSVATAAVSHTGAIPTSGPASAGGRGGFGAGGAVPGEAAASAELTALLQATGTKWSAIVSGATTAANLELASNTSVISLGGWNGSDPYPTLDEFKAMVANGDIGYFIAGGQGGGGFGGGGLGGGGLGGSQGGSSAVAQWVQSNFTAITVGGSTVYKLTN